MREFMYKSKHILTFIEFLPFLDLIICVNGLLKKNSINKSNIAITSWFTVVYLQVRSRDTQLSELRHMFMNGKR